MACLPNVLSLSLFLSPGVCLITVSMAAGVNRRGIVSAVPVMEQDTLEPPATLVSVWVCACSCVFLPVCFYSHLNTTVFCFLCVCFFFYLAFLCSHWVIKLFPHPKPQSSAEGQMNFWSVQRPGFSDCFVCFVLVWEEATRPKAPAHKENRVRKRKEKKPKRVFFKRLKYLRRPSLLPYARNIVRLLERMREKYFGNIIYVQHKTTDSVWKERKRHCSGYSIAEGRRSLNNITKEMRNRQ